MTADYYDTYVEKSKEEKEPYFIMRKTGHDGWCFNYGVGEEEKMVSREEMGELLGWIGDGISEMEGEE